MREIGTEIDEMMGQQLSLPGAWILETDPPQTLRVVAAGFEYRQLDVLIADQASAAIDRAGSNAPALKVGLGASHAEAAGKLPITQSLKAQRFGQPRL